MRKYLGALFASAMFVATFAAAPSPASAHGSYDSLLAKVKRATTKYHDIDEAVEDGYVPTDLCVAMPGGGMGYHYVNPTLVDDIVDAFRPEIIVYVPSSDGPRLGALEYLKPDADQDLTTFDDRPTLFDVPFDGPMEGHEPGMPIHYDLHVWLWKHNPDGMFAGFNPRVTCP